MDYILKQFKASDEESKARAAFQVGMYLYGYCCGFFGRDSYGKKRIVDITKDEICVIEKGVYNSANTTASHFSWVDLIESSNRDLESQDYDWAKEDE